jgi:tRNA-modifying protein YgfZ
MESPLLRTEGAVGAEFPDVGVAMHYGDPFGEQRALVEAAGFVDRSDRDIVKVTGPDRLGWINSISTQKLDGLRPGEATQTLVLSPQGHVEHHLSLVDDGEATWIHVEPGEAEPLIEFLNSMRFMLRVEVADVSTDYALITVMGQAVPDDLSPDLVLDFGYAADHVIERAALTQTAARYQDRGLRIAGMWAHEALRIAGHRARFGTDTDHRTIPHEVGWIETAVHLTKGCYRGQETVARVHNLGHPPRRLVLLNLDGSDDRLPEHGEAVVVGEEDSKVGFVGSAARHYELGPIALALVKRTVPVSETLRVAGISAAQEVIVSPDAGANVKITLGRRRSLL